MVRGASWAPIALLSCWWQIVACCSLHVTHAAVSTMQGGGAMDLFSSLSSKMTCGTVHALKVDRNAVSRQTFKTCTCSKGKSTSIHDIILS